MASLIKGITVNLYQTKRIGTDAFNAPIFEEIPVAVDNVLVKPAESEEIVSGLQLYGKRAVYELSIPKGDTHVWENKRVEFFGQVWETFGFPKEYIEELVPMDWNKKVMVQRYG